MSSPISDASALPLLVWLSPSFPVGAFAYSHGIEAAFDSGDLTGAATLHAWLADLLEFGSPRADAVLLAEVWRAAMADDSVRLADVNDLALALAPSRERYAETLMQGRAFAQAVRASWPAAGLDLYNACRDDEIALPIAVGVAAAAHGIGLAATLEAFVLAAISNLVSAALRLGPIGQTEAQGIIAGLLPDIRACAAFAAASSLADLGGAALRSDIASMRHETQYSRLFRS